MNFSTAAEDAIHRSIETHPVQSVSPSELVNFYDIERTATEIISGDYKSIALQFPDQLLCDSVPVVKLLKARIGLGRQLYVLADTSYGSCCVDEVAASHANADAIVHYGHACMSLPSRLPVIYVFGKQTLNVEHFVSEFVSALNTEPPDSSRNILLKHDVAFAHLADQLFDQLEEALKPSGACLIHSATPIKAEPTPFTAIRQSESTSPNVDTILYIGEDSRSLTNLLMTNLSCKVYSFNPQIETVRLESVRTNKLLMRRYATLQKARDADVFGILVGTLGVASYLPVITYLRSLLSSKHKKSYTISVGKLNPSKLANFLEIQCFVLVACPENSLLDESTKDFMRPIVTPYELKMALEDEPSWLQEYILDFDRLLRLEKDDDGFKAAHVTDGEVGEQTDTTEEDADKPIFSLITGSYRHAKRYTTSKDSKMKNDDNNPTSAALVVRDQNTALAGITAGSAAAEFLRERTYRGLDPRLGQDSPSILEQGRSGIARGYQDDFEHQQ